MADGADIARNDWGGLKSQFLRNNTVRRVRKDLSNPNLSSAERAWIYARAGVSAEGKYGAVRAVCTLSDEELLAIDKSLKQGAKIISKARGNLKVF